ncbi:MAG: metallophosphoesterase family protein [Promethearchaeota archaeon]
MKDQGRRTVGKSLILLAISASFAGIFVAGLFMTNRLELLRPRWNVPEMCLPGDSITIEADLDIPATTTSSYSAMISSEVGSFNLTINDVKLSGNKIIANVSIPTSVINDTLYNLTVRWGGLSDTQPHAIKVLSEYKTEFKVIFLADSQVGYSPEYKDVWIYSFDNFAETVRQINIINPEFVILLGDITETALKEEYQFIYKHSMELKVPIYAGPGNHDWFSTEEYKRWCHYFNFSFDYGADYHFTYIDTGMNLNALKDFHFKWLVHDLEQHSSVPVKIVLGHAPPFECDSVDQPSDINRNFEMYQQEFLDLMDQNDVLAYFYGHNHKDKAGFMAPTCEEYDPEKSYNDTLFIQTNDGKEDSGYRVVYFKNKSMYNFTRKINATTFHSRESLTAYTDPESDNPASNLFTSFNTTWDIEGGSAPPSAIQFNITNKFLYESFNDAMIRVTLNGSVNSTFQLNSNATGNVNILRILPRIDVPNVVIMEILVDIPQNSVITIEVEQP